MTWSIRETVPVLAVPTLESGIAFYDRLGFGVEWTWPEDSPTHAGLRRGGCAIQLSRCDPAMSAEVCFRVDDVDACHAEVMAARPWELAAEAGALATRPDCPPKRALQAPDPPEDKPWGHREMTLLDPWGHLLVFSQES
ncbi:MAG: hypothetical protein RL885_29265 [Planctomycetota bacterium]